MSRLGILAGTGALPQRLAAAHPGALFVQFEGLDVPRPSNPVLTASYERFGALFEGLHAQGVTEVVFAGGLARPQLDPTRFDAKMRQLAPGFFAAMQSGDDGLLRAVIEAFLAEGFHVRGAHELLPGLTATAGVLAGPAPAQGFDADAQKGAAVVRALSAQDVGQGAVVARGAVLGVETLQGTDAMLRFVAQTDPGLHPGGGVLFKGPKAGQDLRIDMPAIGPQTLRNAAQARLSGVAIAAERVLVLERDETLQLAAELGITLAAIDA